MRMVTWLQVSAVDADPTGVSADPRVIEAVASGPEIRRFG